MQGKPKKCVVLGWFRSRSWEKASLKRVSSVHSPATREFSQNQHLKYCVIVIRGRVSKKYRMIKNSPEMNDSEADPIAKKNPEWKILFFSRRNLDFQIVDLEIFSVNSELLRFYRASLHICLVRKVPFISKSEVFGNCNGCFFTDRANTT